MDKESYIAKNKKTAYDFYCAIKELSKDEKFINANDADKLKQIPLEFQRFHADFPVVTKYLVCMGQFNMKAYLRYMELVTTPPTEKEKTMDKEELWIQQQAKYVQFLWESYQKGKESRLESNRVRREAYDTLKKEMEEFKEMQDTIKEELKEENTINKKELTVELLKRLVNQEQSLKEADIQSLITTLKSVQKKE